MSLAADLLRSILLLGLPVAGISFALLWWAVRRGSIEGGGDASALAQSLEALKGDADRRGGAGYLHGKWFRLGGGFYGVVGLYTYALIEFDELAELFSGLADLVLRLDVGVLVGFLIESLMNFIAALAWPLYWMERAGSGRFWLWFLVAYGAYWLGLRLAAAVLARGE